jgi:hypothetical protein
MIWKISDHALEAILNENRPEAVEAIRAVMAALVAVR